MILLTKSVNLLQIHFFSSFRSPFKKEDLKLNTSIEKEKKSSCATFFSDLPSEKARFNKRIEGELKALQRFFDAGRITLSSDKESDRTDYQVELYTRLFCLMEQFTQDKQKSHHALFMQLENLSKNIQKKYSLHESLQRICQLGAQSEMPLIKLLVEKNNLDPEEFNQKLQDWSENMKQKIFNFLEEHITASQTSTYP